MFLFNMAANFVHPVTPTIIVSLDLNDYMFGLVLAGLIYEVSPRLPFVFGFGTFAVAAVIMLLFCRAEKAALTIPRKNSV